MKILQTRTATRLHLHSLTPRFLKTLKKLSLYLEITAHSIVRRSSRWALKRKRKVLKPDRPLLNHLRLSHLSSLKCKNKPLMLHRPPLQTICNHRDQLEQQPRMPSWFINLSKSQANQWLQLLQRKRSKSKQSLNNNLFSKRSLHLWT